MNVNHMSSRNTYSHITVLPGLSGAEAKWTVAFSFDEESRYAEDCGHVEKCEEKRKQIDVAGHMQSEIRKHRISCFAITGHARGTNAVSFNTTLNINSGSRHV